MAPTLSVDRLLNTYVVPQDYPAPDEVRKELDDVARKHVTDSLASALASLLDPQDHSVWLIDAITMDVVMDLNAAAPEEIGAFWARKMAESVVKVITRGEDGERVMRFANRAEYLAYFLRDLAGGSAWGKWHYRQFESLRSLPSRPAIREALLREPEQAEAALLHLVRTGGITAVTRSLSPLDHERLLQLCSAQEATPNKKCFEAALQVWAATPPERSNAPRALDLYLPLRLAAPEGVAAEARGAVRHLLCLDRWARKSQLMEIVTAAATGRVPRLLQAMAPREQETALYLGFLANQDSDLPLRLAAIARARHPQAWPTTASPQTETETNPGVASPWSGVFLLLPALIADEDLMMAYGKAEDGVLRYLLLGAAMHASFVEAQHDRALGAAAGLDSSPDLPALVPVLTQAGHKTNLEALRQTLLPQDLEQADAASARCWPDLVLGQSLRGDLPLAAAALLRNFARQLPGLGKSSFDYLRRNVLSGGGVIRTVPGQIVVELAPRPLDMVLHMAGFNHMRFSLPWLADTEMVIGFGPQ